ncbi:hypothetical protein DSO57_1012725 [Entomophthora muscae]|uniref:Uncharacterized protein n=2 Tax=Entomophthora muscae TaxID=34485 RepID=A0ACC2SS73_9FUNG|nr:hypothetical protein DSO57_1024922 [Entomophthora muscae]KAJ9070031.1 hypothetical protein DSO57_1012725 [Entomophthora muscae]
MRGEGTRTIIPSAYHLNNSEPILWARPKLTECVVPECVRSQMREIGFDAMLVGPNRDHTIRVTLTPKLGSDHRSSSRAFKRLSSFASTIPFIPSQRPTKQASRSCIKQFLRISKEKSLSIPPIN